MEYDCCVIGIGRLGLCFAVTLENTGLKVVGVDVNHEYVNKINTKQLHSDEPELSNALKLTKNFTATTNLNEAVINSRNIFILVATPTDGGKYYYDHNCLSDVLVKLNNLELRDKSIIINSTVFPGYIKHIGNVLLDKCERCTLSYNPAFVAQGDVMSGYKTGGWFGMVLIGAANDEVADKLTQLYKNIVKGRDDVNICIMTPESAEICKLASNCFRTMKISFANMIGDIADKTIGADKHDICNALKSDKSIGPICMTPGYGFGGPCYPRDNKALAMYSAKLGIQPLIPRAVDDYNDIHHDIITKKMFESIDDIIEFENVTYKPNCAVAMIDKSPKLEVAYALSRMGRCVKIKDRYSVIIEVMKEYGDAFTYETIN
jgi:nucleotide sugar dehydrogenase